MLQQMLEVTAKIRSSSPKWNPCLHESIVCYQATRRTHVRWPSKQKKKKNNITPWH